MIMTPKHPLWNEFVNQLTQTLCKHNHTNAIAILTNMKLDVAESIRYFESHGGYCDCEIIFNIRRVT